MAQKQASQATGQKRGRPPRASRNAEPVAKKARTESPAQVAPASVAPSPAVETPAPEERIPRLPVKVADNRPLPSLPKVQPATLSDADYQSIAASAVLSTSLDRSRVRWVADGILERYWVKPETGKHARPPPPNNPEVKWQKHQGPCRIRVEPHILEVDLYVEQKPKPPAPKQYYPIGASFKQTPWYGGQPQQPNAASSQRVLSPMQPAQGNAHGIQPSSGPPLAPQVHQPPPRAQQPTPPQAKKPPTDPVISMLASRASSDPVLKALMKEVATGNATQEQLKVFQAHIDELTKIINDKKKKEEEEQTVRNSTAAGQQQQQQQQLPNDGIRYEGQTNNTASIPQPKAFQPPLPAQPPQQHQQQPPQPPATSTFRPPPAPYQPPPPPPPPARQAVILAFTSPGASEDRFLFPQYSILESLSPQHLLASFIVTKHGREAADPTGLDPETEYWQPITLMVEVAYKREHFLDFIKRWVKPADEVRANMEETMKRCARAPVHSLALRLPVKGTEAAESEDAPPEIALPVAEPTPPPEKGGKKTVKYVRKNAKKTADAETGKAATESGKATLESGKTAPAPESAKKTADEAGKTTDGPAATKPTMETDGVSAPNAAPANEPTTTAAAAAPAIAPAVAPVADAAFEKRQETNAMEGVVKEKDDKPTAETSHEQNTTANAPAESSEEAENAGRPKRAVRKSVRISDAA